MTRLISPAEVLQQFDILTKGSELLKASQRGKKDLRTLAKDLGAKKISSKDTAKLQKNQVRAESFKNVYVLPGFNPSRINGVSLSGVVILGSTRGKITLPNGISLACGIERAALNDCVIMDECLIQDVSLISQVIVESDVVVLGSRAILGTKNSSFGCGDSRSFGLESEGRDVAVFAEISIPIAAAVAGRRENKKFALQYAKKISSYAAKARSGFTTISKGARVLDTGRIEGSFIGPSAQILSCGGILNTCVLSNKSSPTRLEEGAWIRNSVVQWGAEVTSMAVIRNSVLGERAKVEKHGKITESYIGPNSVVAEGEITASLVGPFVSAHHQSLLIAAFWPEGKGNLAYGANVGSNHTSKAPDQEIWPGEGTFFGLGSSIKFPTDLSGAPFSLFATGITSLPQKIGLPFSLINVPMSPPPGISTAYNEILPGWVLSDNPYTLMRNESKYSQRNKAVKSALELRVLHPGTVETMLRGRRALMAASGKSIYSEKEISAVGKNFLLEENRIKGIEAYTFYIRIYALRTLWKFIKSKPKSKKKLDTASVLDALGATKNPELLQVKNILREEWPKLSIKRALLELQEKEKLISKAVRISKEKDDTRGRRLIMDYDETHLPALKDSLVLETAKQAKKTRAEIKTFLSKNG